MTALELRENLHPSGALSQTHHKPRLALGSFAFTDHYQLRIFYISVMNKRQFWILYVLANDSVTACDL